MSGGSGGLPSSGRQEFGRRDREQVATVTLTAPDEAVAESVVRALLDANLIACGQVVPGAMSLYRWNGEVVRARELVVTLKTLLRLVPAVCERVAQLHPFEVPEILVQEVVGGSPAYLQWVRSECRPAAGPEQDR